MSPLGRPLASSGPWQSPRKRTGSPATTAAKDARPSSSSSYRISSTRLDVIASSLTDLDQEVIYGVSRLRLVTGLQLQRLFWPGGTAAQARAARRGLGRLTDWRVLDRLPQRVGGIRAGSSGHCYFLGPAGHRLSVRQGFTLKRLAEPGDRLVRHTLAIAEVVTQLHEAQRAGDLDIIEVQTEPTCWRGFLGLMGARVILRPDLFCRIGSGAYEDRWFVEVDLATESRSTLAGKARRYLSHYRSGSEQREHGVYPRVVWSVPDGRRAEVLEDALRTLPPAAQHLFVVVTSADLIGYVRSEAGS